MGEAGNGPTTVGGLGAMRQKIGNSRLNEKLGAWFVGFAEFDFAGGAGFFE